MTAPILDLDRDFLVRRVGPLLAAAPGRRFFVTGGTGFVGSWILEALAAANDRLALGLSVTVLTRDPDAFGRRLARLAGHPMVRVIRGDVRTLTPREGPYDFVVHAAFDSSRALRPEETRSVIATGTERCLELARSSRALRFLFVSSGAVYGRQPAGMAQVAEDLADDPALAGRRTDYGEAKYRAERLALQAGPESGFDVVIARGFAFVGPRLPLDAHFAIGNFIRDALAGGPIRVRGDGTAVRSYLYAADLAAWLLTILLRGRPGKAYNVGSEEAATIAELARRVAGVVAPGLAVEIAGKPSCGDSDRYVPDTRRARGELGLDVTVGLSEAIARTVTWYRKGLSAPVH